MCGRPTLNKIGRMYDIIIILKSQMYRLCGALLRLPQLKDDRCSNYVFVYVHVCTCPCTMCKHV